MGPSQKIPHLVARGYLPNITEAASPQKLYAISRQRQQSSILLNTTTTLLLIIVRFVRVAASRY